MGSTPIDMPAIPAMGTHRRSDEIAFSFPRVATKVIIKETVTALGKKLPNRKATPKIQRTRKMPFFPWSEFRISCIFFNKEVLAKAADRPYMPTIRKMT